MFNLCIIFSVNRNFPLKTQFDYATEKKIVLFFIYKILLYFKVETCSNPKDVTGASRCNKLSTNCTRLHDGSKKTKGTG